MNDLIKSLPDTSLQEDPQKIYRSVREYTELLMRPLSAEDHLAQPITDVSPPKWHLGHTSWFFEAMILKVFLKNYQEYDPRFPFYFNSYYQGMGARLERDQRGCLTRPPLEEVYDYRRYVDDHMLKLLAENDRAEILELLELGLNHEQQHQELFLTDFKYILSTQAFHPVYEESFSEGTPESDEGWIQAPEGVHEIGHAGDGFAYDNETSRHKVYLRPFEISKKLVTNGEWLQFIKAGGYEDYRYWHSDGWAWLQEEQIKAPLYWQKLDGHWQRFSLSGLEPVKADEPVAHISYYEASAFAEWRDMRLPTEAEWEVAADNFNWGQRWEWTNSAYLPYPGYRRYEGPASEYNGKFMVNQMVLRGASIATSPGHARKTYRNFFHAPLRWQFTGLRLAR